MQKSRSIVDTYNLSVSKVARLEGVDNDFVNYIGQDELFESKNY